MMARPLAQARSAAVASARVLNHEETAYANASISVSGSCSKRHCIREFVRTALQHAHQHMNDCGTHA